MGLPINILPLGAYRAALGEGPLWDHRRNHLLYVDILSRLLIVMLRDGTVLQKLPFTEGITSVGLADNGGYIATSEKRFMLLDENFSTIWESPQVDTDQPNNRFNDGKTCPSGRYWAGTMERDLNGRTGALHCLQYRVPTVRDYGYRVTNGPAFSPDGRVLYHTDTLDRVIYRFDLDSDGFISKKSLFASFDETDGGPDGMTVDCLGRLYVGHFGGSRISRLTPDGKIDGSISMPVKNVTSLTFGGDDFATLFVTSAHCTFERAELIERPLEGATFAVDCGASGFAQPLFKCEAN